MTQAELFFKNVYPKLFAVALIASVFTVALSYFTLTGIGPLLIIDLGSLAMISFLGMFAPAWFTTIYFVTLPQIAAIRKIFFVSFSLFCIGLLFKIMHWPGGENFYAIGAAGTVLSLASNTLMQIFSSNRN